MIPKILSHLTCDSVRCLGGAGLLLVGRGRKGSFEIPLGECAAPVCELYLNMTSHSTAQWMKPFCVKT